MERTVHDDEPLRSISEQQCHSKISTPPKSGKIPFNISFIFDPHDLSSNDDSFDEESKDIVSVPKNTRPLDDAKPITIDQSHQARSDRVMSVCVQLLTYFHISAVNGAGLVIPYYVLSTPENGWTVSDLSIIFATFNIGGIVASQICMVAECAKTHRNFVLSILHLLAFVFGFIGFLLMSSIFGFNMPLFYFGAFLSGISKDTTTIQSYGPLVSRTDGAKKALMAKVGKVIISAGIINSFLLPAVYENAGFQLFCGVMCIYQIMAIIALCTLWHFIRKNKDNSNTDKHDQVRGAKTNAESQSEVKIPLLKLLSPSMFILLGIVFLSGLFQKMYTSSYPIVFVSHFGISATVGGYLNAAAALFAFLVLSILLKLSSRSKVFQYPYDVIFLFGMFMFGNVLYVVFYAPWIAYSFHWVICLLPAVMRGGEMVSRLYLCPPVAFNRVTSVSGVLKSVGFFLGSVTGPMLCTISLRAPFMVLTALSALSLIVIIAAFIRRKRFLSVFYDEVAEHYLLTERRHYMQIKTSCIRRYSIYGATNIDVEKLERKSIQLVKRALSYDRVSMPLLLRSCSHAF